MKDEKTPEELEKTKSTRSLKNWVSWWGMSNGGELMLGRDMTR
jgi:hypothetical protein